MRVKTWDELGLQKCAEEKISKGECWIGRYWGQTRICIPPQIGYKIGAERLQALAEEVFTKGDLESDINLLYFHPDCIHLELPPVIDYPGGEAQKETEKYKRPDRLVELIMQEARK